MMDMVMYIDNPLLGLIIEMKIKAKENLWGIYQVTCRERRMENVAYKIRFWKRQYSLYTNMKEGSDRD